MNKGMFSGWRDVFSFSLKQATGKKFRNATLGTALVMLVAGLAAEGVTKVGGVRHILRGYEDPVRDLAALGAKIEWES